MSSSLGVFTSASPFSALSFRALAASSLCEERVVVTSSSSSSRGNDAKRHRRRRQKHHRAGAARAEQNNALPSSDQRRENSSSFTSSSSASGRRRSRRSADTNSPEEVLRRAEELGALVQDIAQVAASSGPAGVSRTAQAMRAIFELGVKTLQSGNLERLTAPSALRQLFEALGATYIKFGQFIASTPSAFPKEFVDEFQKCLDDTPPVSFQEIKKILEEEGLDIDREFYSIDPKPLATASVAQVHAAVLKGSNKEVVVKVLKPGVEDVLKADLSFALVASKVFTFLNPGLNRASLVDIVSDLRSSMMEETDFRKEAKNVRDFTRFIESSKLESLATAPFVYEKLSSKRVLVMERLYGSPLTNLEDVENELKKNGRVAMNPLNPSVKLTAEDVLVNALNVWFSSVLACETFHADVHAGNLLALSDGRVGFIDFGIVGSLSVETYESVRAFFAATATRDYDKMALSLITMGAAEKDVDASKFANDLREVYKALDEIEPTVVVDERSQTAAVSVDQLEAQNVALKIIQAGEENGVKFPRAFGALLKQILYFDRYITALAPDVSAIDDERLDFVDAVVVDVKDGRQIP
jgi:aarF domain-containing kinase